MTGRERFLLTMRGGARAPDRVPYLEEGLRDDVLDAWRGQGLTQDADLAAMFHFDRREQIGLHLGPRPALESWPTSLADLDILRDRLDPDDPERVPADWADRVRAWRDRDHILELFVHPGMFQTLGVNDWRRLEELLYQVADDAGIVRATMEVFGDFLARLVQRVLRDVEVDFATFSEPIAGNDRPLLSPGSYRQLALETYAPIVAALRDGGVETVLFQTYANTRVLLPAVVGAGFNALWAIETNPDAMDYVSIRREFGPELRLIGGIDLDTVLLGPDAIRQEIDVKVAPLLEGGGYIPLADGRVRANVPFAYYRAYREALVEATTGPRA